MNHTLEVTYLVDGKVLYSAVLDDKTEKQVWSLRDRLIKTIEITRGNSEQTQDSNQRVIS